LAHWLYFLRLWELENFQKFSDSLSDIQVYSNSLNSLPNSVVDACSVNAFKARLDKFWLYQAVKFDFTTDLPGTGSGGNRSEEVIE